MDCQVLVCSGTNVVCIGRSPVTGSAVFQSIVVCWCGRGVENVFGRGWVV
jgi:hypothetical protein